MRYNCQLITRFLKDSTGDANAARDFSGEATEFIICPENDQMFCLSTLNIVIADVGAFTPFTYGCRSGLVNGIAVQEHDSEGIVNDFTNGNVITNNLGWAGYGDSVDFITWDAGHKTLISRYNFSDCHRVQLDSLKGDYLAVILNDDFSGLSAHNFFVTGFISRYDLP